MDFSKGEGGAIYADCFNPINDFFPFVYVNYVRKKSKMSSEIKVINLRGLKLFWNQL